MASPRSQRLSSSVELRKLFLTIAHAAVASSCLSGCGQEHPADERERADTGLASTAQSDGSIPAPSDASTSLGLDASASSPDSGSKAPLDSGLFSGDAASDAAPDTGPDGSDWQLVACPFSTALPDAPIQSSQAPSYLGIFHHAYGQCCAPPDGGSPPIYTSEAARIGTPCPGDAGTCPQELQQLSERTCATSLCTTAVAKVDSKFVRFEQRTELLKLLGDIDSSSEAVLLAAFDGHFVCHGMREDPRDIGSEVRSTNQGYELRTTWANCSPLVRETLRVSRDGGSEVTATETLKPATCSAGRRPPGFRSVEIRADQNPAGSFLAELARLEHASIFAFYQLMLELDALGAPEALTGAARAALRDEVRHALQMRRLARAHGQDVACVTPTLAPLRSLLEIAHDNAREGCVRETFGALLATYQGVCAQDERVRAAMVRIAEDETRHAAFSWQLMAWIAPQLSSPERAAVDETRRRAMDELSRELAHTLPERERRALGLPSPEVASALLRHMSSALRDLPPVVLS